MENCKHYVKGDVSPIITYCLLCACVIVSTKYLLMPEFDK